MSFCAHWDLLGYRERGDVKGKITEQVWFTANRFIVVTINLLINELKLKSRASQLQYPLRRNEVPPILSLKTPTNLSK